MADKRPFANRIRPYGGKITEDKPALTGNFVYIVQWSDGVIKVGFASKRYRWRKFVCRGARLLNLASFPSCTDALNAEASLHAFFASKFPPAFASKEDARNHLGDGCGYLDCYSGGTRG